MLASRQNIITVSADEFYLKFKYHKDNNTIINTERVLLRDLDYYKEKCNFFFMTDDKAAGFALEKDGRIISVFKGNCRYEGVGKILLDIAIENHGCKLECNDVEQLRHIYGLSGFLPVSKAPLDKNDMYYSILKEKETDKDHGTTLIFWIFNSELREKNKSKNPPTINFVNVSHFDSEDKAEEFRDKLLDDANIDERVREYISKIVDYYIFS